MEKERIFSPRKFLGAILTHTMGSIAKIGLTSYDLGKPGRNDHIEEREYEGAGRTMDRKALYSNPLLSW